MNYTTNQKGISLIGWLLVLTLFLFMGYTAVKIIPAYTENYTLKNIVQSAIKDVPFSPDYGLEVYETQFKERFRKDLLINQIRSIGPDSLILSRNGSVVNVELKYDVTSSFIQNMDFLFHFDDYFQAG
jgi:hypothetical protein